MITYVYILSTVYFHTYACSGMENKLNVSKHGSMPPFSEEDRDSVSSSIFSAATHPSVHSRNKDDLLNRIRSGNDVLCRLPMRIDPNITFSDDDEEELSCKNSEGENKAPSELDKTPKLKQHPKSVHTLPSGRLRQMWSSNPLKEDFTPQANNQVNRQHYFSATKAPSDDVFFKKRTPLTESKSKNPQKSSDKTKMNLMCQPEFKVPLPAVAKYPTHDTIIVNQKPYSILSQLGAGGSCKVFSVFGADKSLVAVKCVDLKGTDPLIREGYKKEIEYLQKLQGSNRVIKLFDFEYRENELFLVLERGEIDFAKYISNEAKLKRLAPLTIKFYWAQMLEAVSDIHQYGIVHSDLKPANFLLVAGNLKLIDFGIATSVPEDKTSTFRDTQVGTLNFMSPEAITQLSTSNSNEIRFKVGVKSDVWSLGCILYNLVYGVTPFYSVKTLMQKIYAITSPSYEIDFRPLPDKRLVDVLKKCLERDPKERASVDELLRHPYLKEAPSSKSPDSAQSNELSSVMAQMQVLTPRRMSLLTKVVQELSEKQN